MVLSRQLTDGIYIKMRKSLFIINLAFVSASVCGMATRFDCHEHNRSKQVISPQPSENSELSTRRSERLQLRQVVQQSLQEASTSSNTGEKSFEDFLPQNIESEKSILRQKDPEKLEKIENYLRQRKREKNYSLDLIEKVLVHYCLHTETPIAEIAENYGIDYSALRSYISKAKISKIPFHKLTEEQINRALKMRREKKSIIEAAETNGINHCTVQRYAKKRGENPLRNKIDEEKILELYKNGKTFKDFYELVTSNENNAKKKLAEVISEKMTDLQKEQLVSENMDIIKDYREKLLTDKGRLDKYKDREIQMGDLCTRKFGECEDYLIRNIAVKLGYDLSKSPVEWNIEYKSLMDVPKNMEQSIVEEFNKGFLTYGGLAQKYKVKSKTVRTILLRRNSDQIYRRHAKRNSYKYMSLKSANAVKRLQNNLGYQQCTAKTFKTCVDQWYKLNLDQKKLFKNILNSDIRKMPSDEELDEIKSLKYVNNTVNEKFRKLLLILCNREDEIKITPNSIRRLKQQLGVWEKLAENDQTN